MVVKEFLSDDAQKAWKWVQRGLIGFTALFAANSAIYNVDTDSMGVVKRFGEFSKTTDPGLRFKLPWPIESVTEVPVRRVQREEFGFRTLESGLDSKFLSTTEIKDGSADPQDLKDFLNDNNQDSDFSGRELYDETLDFLRGEYLMLTGDLNMADVEWVVQYRIGNPADYLFNVRGPRHTIRDASQAVMRELIGNGSVDEAITVGRIEYQNQGKLKLQALLDEYQTGISVVTVEMQSSNPPFRVRPAFNEVNEAMQEKEQKINEAMRVYNTEVPRASGEALGIINQAEGYAAERRNQALGDIAKFSQIYDEYMNAPDITRARMYLEVMDEVLPEIAEKWIIEGGDSTVLKLLNLGGEINE